MKIVDLLVIVFGTAMTSDYVYSKPTEGYNTILSHDDIIRVKKHHEESSVSSGYLEQCGIVSFPKARQGFVNVLAFLDSSWPYSHRQAVMLEMLNKRLQRSGLPDTLFFVVNIDPSFVRTVDAAEDDMEREAWLGVSPEEIERPDIDKTSDSLAMRINPDIQLIQDNEDLGIWKELRGSRDQVLVIDRCGKLTYQVIVPWSILHFPYVKAAILSTYKDEPCGPCIVVHNTTTATTENYDEGLSVTEPFDTETKLFTTEAYFQNDRESIIAASDIPIGMKYDPSTDSNIETSSVDSEKFVSWTESENESTSESLTTDSIETGTEINFLKGFDIISDSTDNIIRDKDSGSTAAASVTDIIFYDSTTPENEYISTTNLQEEEADANTSSNNEDNFMQKANNEASTDATSITNSDFTDTISDLTVSTTNDYTATNVDTYLETVLIDTTSEEITDKPSKRYYSIEKKSDILDDNYSNLLHNRVIKNSEIEENPSLSDMPIRIIMHAPHFHVDGDSTRMHEYMVFKTGSSGYHGHLASYDATRLYRGPQDFQEEQLNLPSFEIQEKQWPMTNVFYGKDESPGLYGEVADYWRGLENQESYDDTEETERPEEQVAEKTGSDDKISKKPLEASNDKIANESLMYSTDNSETTTGTIEKVQTDSESESVTVNEATSTDEFNPEEEETRNRLIAHYSKLLPWIYYVLDK